nr:hypothetical protein [Tanacetum cinerariifolium]
DEEPTKKRTAKKTLLQESFKKLRAEVEVSGFSSTQQDTPTVDPTKISKEDVQNMLQIIPMAEFKGRMEEDVTASKEINAAEPIVFDDEEVTMTMAQTLIKIKAKKQRILDEQMAKRLQDEEIEQAAARER